MKTLRFTVDSALLSEIGEKLVETVHIALAELVKNSYDADATEVSVEFLENDEGRPEIHIVDNGCGMNFKEVEQYWMRIATTNKALRSISTQYGRPKTGAKGIGRFCCRRLGQELRLVTTGKYEKTGKLQETDVEFKWKRFKPGTDVSEIECSGEQQITVKGKTGTTLIIKELAEEWTTRGYNYLKRQLAVLSANRGIKREGYIEDPGFSVFIKAPDFEEGVRDIREDFINAGWGTLKAYLNTKHQAVCELNALEIGRRTITSKMNFKNLNEVSLKIGIFPDRKDQYRDSTIAAQWNIHKILPEWGGVQIKYKGFRVYPYGDDDWLCLDKDRGLRKGAPNEELINIASSLEGVTPARSLIILLSMRSHVGSVEIGPHSEGFKLKASREGFVRSSSFDELKEFVRFAIDWSTIYRDFFIRKRAEKDAGMAREYLEDKLEKEIEPDKIIDSAVHYIKKEIETITDLLPQKEKEKIKQSMSIATDAIIKQELSNKQQLHHLRLIASNSILLLIFSHEVKSLLGSLDLISSLISTLIKKMQPHESTKLKEITAEITGTKKRFNDLLNMTSLLGIDSKKSKVSDIALKERIKQSEKILHLILKRYDIIIDHSEVPNNTLVKNIMEPEVFAIILNILSNSIKSIIAARSEKIIKIKAGKKEGKTSITFMDTGIGLDPAYFEDVFQPFIADPEGRLYDTLENNLNPEDKYIVGSGSGLGLTHLLQLKFLTIYPIKN
jgi:signal transduction histidine kinase